MERVEHERKHINIYNKTLLNAHSHTEFNKLHLTVKNVDIDDGNDKMLDHTTHVHKRIEPNETRWEKCDKRVNALSIWRFVKCSALCI